MGNNLSYIVECLYPVRSEERLEELRRLLLDQEVSTQNLNDLTLTSYTAFVQPY
jgi:hypothetical protein